MRETKGVTGEAALRGLVFAGAVDAPPPSCFSSFVLPSPCCAFSPSLSPLSLLHQLAVVTFIFLSAVSSAWHSVWRMMVTPEGGLMCAAPSPPLTTTSTSLQGGQHDTDEI